MINLTNIRFLNGGYCLQFERMAGVRSWKVRRFQAVFVAFDHPVAGPCLIDAGYGPVNLGKARNWPWILLHWLMPIPRHQTFSEADYHDHLSLDAKASYNIFVSHFHPDHIGGLSLFPNARFIYRRASHEYLTNLSSLRQLTHGFVPHLLPSDFAERGATFEESVFSCNYWPDLELKTHDYFQDGSLILIDLPGHAVGHTGYLLRGCESSMLYVVDAFWDRRALESNRKLPWISRRTAHDPNAYTATQVQLKKLTNRYGVEPFACHCPATQEYVEVQN